jgi:hypothetical protein
MEVGRTHPERPEAGKGAGVVGSAADALAESMAEHARAFLAAVEATQSREAALPLAPATHRDWHYVPRERPGLPLRAMTDVQQALAWALVAAPLSGRGLRQAHGVLALEAILFERSGRSAFRDPSNYALAIFGRPERGVAWAWRFEGHHLSLTFTIAPGTGVAVTPHFVGANPASGQVLGPDHDEVLLGPETRLAFAVIRGLDAAAQDLALLDAASPKDIVTGPGREQSLAAPRGVPVAGMREPEQRQVTALLEAYAHRLRPELAERELTRVRQAGLERLHFAWAGPVQEGERHYYRLHGPTLLVEYDNTTGDHVHTVWHDPTDPFGEDHLRRHRERDHGH